MPSPIVRPAAETAGRSLESKERSAALRMLVASALGTLARLHPLRYAELLIFAERDELRVLALDDSGEAVERAATREEFPARVWEPLAHGLQRVELAAQSESPGEQRLLVHGAHSLILAPLGPPDARLGLLLLAPEAEASLDVTSLVDSLSQFLSAAIERDRLWARDERRHQRRVRLEAMLPRIAESLDVRKVFVDLAEVVREVIPHDVLVFALLNTDRTGVRVQATTHQGVMELPEYRFSNEEEALDANWQFLLSYDLSPVDAESVRSRISPLGAEPPVFVVTRPGAHWMRFLTAQRVRSTMRVPIRSGERPIGGIAFMSRQPDCFDEEDGVAASRIADQLALALAHQELARHAIEDDRRHRRFAALEAVLPRLAVLEDLDDIAVAVSGVANGILQHDAVGVMVIHADGAHVHGLQDGLHRLTASAPISFVEEQFKSLMPGGSLRIRSLELLDEARNLVRQRVVGPDGDLVREVGVPPSHAQALKTLGVRSELRVAVRQGDELLGLLLFASRIEDHFTEEDEAIARRMADRVSLRLAQERIEGEARRAREASARAVEASARAAELEGRVEQLQRELERFSAHRAIGRSAAWKKALGDAAQVAATDTTVLVTGESGTGKEVIARYIHRGSKRANGPFIALNCAALPEQLMESELFGHERGAFTGAHEARAGKIELASGGVLFLDEVGEMSPAVQAKFLRVLQEREFQRVGGSKTIKADVRIVSATNRDPRAGIRNGSFREDLYYRLGVFEIHLPPLRERPEDILALADAFLQEIGQGIGRPAAGISEEAREQLLAHPWPGNVRELRNAIERAVILCEGGLVTRAHLPMAIADRPREAIATTPSTASTGDDVALGEMERDLLVKAMAKAEQNKSRAAKLLGVSRGQLYSLLRRHGLTDARR